MVKFIFILFISLLTTCNLFAQKKSFEWADTTFEINSSRILPLLYDLDGPCTVTPCYETMYNNLIYDTLIDFLKRNQKIKVAVAVHIDWEKLETEFLNRWSKLRADYVKSVLEEKGIQSERIISIGCGKQDQIIPEDKINSFTDLEERTWKRLKNTRAEVIIRK